jgi:hypothetical protein
MKRIAILSAFAVLLAAQVGWTDCGSIPFKPGVDIFEPNQRAVIAWDGKEEILLLSTDLRASEPTKVLEVIPFPTEPEVTKGDVAVFHKATGLINSRLLAGKQGWGGMGGFGSGALGGAAPPPAGEVTFHEQIGAHDVSVIQVLRPDRFVAWVEEYLQQSGVDHPTISPEIKGVVQEYMRDGFRWFAFNVVELGAETVAKEAIQYQFQTRFLYYPLRITRTEKGETSIRLIILSRRLVRIPNVGAPRVRLMHTPFAISPSELAELDEGLYELLKREPQTLIRLWEIQGVPSRFKRDVVTTWY